jgi:hypothetical protein
VLPYRLAEANGFGSETRTSSAQTRRVRPGPYPAVSPLPVCQELTILAEDEAGRVTALCEHDVVHLTWGWATVHLPREQFALLVRLIRQRHRGDASPTVEGMFELHPRGELHLGNVVLRLTSPELSQLDDLLTISLRRLWSLAREPVPPLGPSGTWRRYEVQRNLPFRN